MFDELFPLVVFVSVDLWLVRKSFRAFYVTAVGFRGKRMFPTAVFKFLRGILKIRR